MSAFRSTHRAPAGGLAAYADHDATAASVASLQPDLPLMVTERWGDWAHITCSNGWQAWVDGRVLVAVAVSGPPSTPTVRVPAATPAPAASPVGVATGGSAFVVSLATVGAGMVALGTVLPWIRGVLSANAFRPPLVFLVDNKTNSTGGLSLGLILLAAAAAGVFALTKDDDRLRRIAGFVSAAVGAVYVIQVQRAFSGTGVSVGDVVGFGVLVSVAGGLLLALGPTKPLGRGQ